MFDGFLFRDPQDRAAVGGGAARVAPAGRKQLDRVRVARHELRQRLFGGLQAHEFRFGAAQRDRTRFRIGQAGQFGKLERDEPGQPRPPARLHHEVGHRAGGRVDDHSQYLAAVSVATHGLTADHERCHGSCLLAWVDQPARPDAAPGLASLSSA